MWTFLSNIWYSESEPPAFVPNILGSSAETPVSKTKYDTIPCILQGIYVNSKNYDSSIALKIQQYEDFDEIANNLSKKGIDIFDIDKQKINYVLYEVHSDKQICTLEESRTLLNTINKTIFGKNSYLDQIDIDKKIFNRDSFCIFAKQNCQNNENMYTYIAYIDTKHDNDSMIISYHVIKFT